MGYDEHQCYDCKYKNTCNFEAIDYSSTGRCDHKIVGFPTKPKIDTPPDERYDNIWNW